MITLENLTKNFGNIEAVKDLNLTINSGECFGLLGRNGAGKSTTIKMMVGLLAPTKGSVRFDGKNIYENPVEVKSKFSYIPDSPYVYEKLSGMEFLFFVGYSHGMTKKQVKEKTKKFIEIFDLQEVIDKKTESYSHGMRQKLIFTAAFMHSPDYLIVDEPMVGLDPQSARAVKDIIRKTTKELGMSVVLTTHQLNVASEICDRVGIVHEGELKSLLEKKEEFGENLEEEFIKLTGGYDTDQLSEIF